MQYTKEQLQIMGVEPPPDDSQEGASPVDAGSLPTVVVHGTKGPFADDFNSDIEAYQQHKGPESFEEFIHNKYHPKDKMGLVKSLYSGANQFIADRPEDVGGYGKIDPPVLRAFQIPGYVAQKVYGALGGDERNQIFNKYVAIRNGNQPSLLAAITHPVNTAENIVNGILSDPAEAARGIVNPENLLANGLGLVGGGAGGLVAKTAGRLIGGAAANALASGESSPGSGFDPAAAAQGGLTGLVMEGVAAPFRAGAKAGMKWYKGRKVPATDVVQNAPVDVSKLDWSNPSSFSQNQMARINDWNTAKMQPLVSDNPGRSAYNITQSKPIQKLLNDKEWIDAKQPEGSPYPENGDLLANTVFQNPLLKDFAQKAGAEYDAAVSSDPSIAATFSKNSWIAKRLADATPEDLGANAVPEKPALTLKPDQIAKLKQNAIPSGMAYNDVLGMSDKQLADAAQAYRQLSLAGEDVSGIQDVPSLPKVRVDKAKAKLAAAQAQNENATLSKAASDELAAAQEANNAYENGRFHLGMSDPLNADYPASGDYFLRLPPASMQEIGNYVGSELRAGNQAPADILARVAGNPATGRSLTEIAESTTLSPSQKAAAIKALMSQVQGQKALNAAIDAPAVDLNAPAPASEPTATAPSGAPLAPEAAPAAAAPTAPAATQPQPEPAAAPPAAPQDPVKTAAQTIMASNEIDAEKAKALVEDCLNLPEVQEALTKAGASPADLKTASSGVTGGAAGRMVKQAQQRLSQVLTDNMGLLQQSFH